MYCQLVSVFGNLAQFHALNPTVVQAFNLTALYNAKCTKINVLIVGFLNTFKYLS